MNSLILAVGAAVLYLIAYHTYGRFIARKIFKIDDKNIPPSEELKDNVDFVPTKRQVLFGHHFASIAGTGPIVGPAIAVFWGWLPALIWIIFGSIFMGAVHDFGALIVSMRNQGRSIGDLSGDIINSRVKTLFLFIIFFLLLIVIAIFGVVIGACFKQFPQAVIPIWAQIPIALTLGYLVYKKNMPALPLGIISAILMYATMVLGTWIPAEMPTIFGISPVGVWVIIFLIYAYIASILPVQVLLQPRDYINAFQLFIALGLLALGIITAHPEMAAPAIQTGKAGAPDMFPMLFVVIACGAISGFHSLVSSGTSSKQCDNEKNSLFIGYGSMLTEGILGIFVILACTAGIGIGLAHENGILTGSDAFNHYYAHWIGQKGLSVKLSAFVTGSKNMIAAIGIPPAVAATIMGVFIVAFAATTLDTATRIQRYIVSEIAVMCKAPAIGKKHPATFIAVFTAFLLAFHEGSGVGAMVLWPLFGCCNQLLAGLALLVVTIYLARKKAPLIFTGLPMVFMIIMTGWAMIETISGFYSSSKWLLFVLGLIIITLEIWMIIESINVFIKVYSDKNIGEQENEGEK